MLRMGETSPLAKGKRIGASNERMALSALAGGLEAMLGQFPTTAEEDEAILRQGDVPPRRRAAVALRAAERRILRASQEAAEQRLSQLDPAKDPRPPPPPAPPAPEPATAAPAEPAPDAEPPAKAAAEVLAEYFKTLEAGGEGAEGGAAPPEPGAAEAAKAELETID